MQQTRGIVFRTVKYSESSVICKIYTEKFGLRSYIINGVRSSKSKTKAALLQPMSLLDMEVYHHEHRNLNRIKELRLYHAYRSIWFHPLKGAVGLFMMEVLNKCIHEEEKNEKLFGFISTTLIETDDCLHLPKDCLLQFLLQLSALLGFSPRGEYSNATPIFSMAEGSFVPAADDLPYHLDLISSQHFSDLMHHLSTDFPAAMRRKLLYALLDYYRLHIVGFSRLKSLAVLEEVFK